MASKEEKKVNELELGQSGTNIFNGIINDEYNPKLSGTAGIAVYDQMRKSDAMVKAALLATQLPIRRASWFVEAASEEDQDIEIKKFVEKSLFELMSITWDDFLRQALLSMAFGVMAFEKVFEIREVDGMQRVVWKKFAPRLPQSIKQWVAGDVEGITQQTMTGRDAIIPMDKLLIFVHEKEGDNWWGTSILRAAYKPWYMKTSLEKIDAIAHERQGIGIPFVSVSANATPEDRAKAETVLRNLRSHEQSFLIEPDDMPVEFKDMKASTTRNASNSIAYHNRQIVVAVLAQFLDLGSGQSGSRALSMDQTDLFLQSLEAVANGIKDVINKYAIKQLVDFNFDNVQNYPELKFTNLSRVNVDSLSTAYQRLTQTGGLQANKKDEQYFRELMSLPPQDTDEIDNTIDEIAIKLDTLSVSLATEDDGMANNQAVQQAMAEQNNLDKKQFNEMIDDQLILAFDRSDEARAKISNSLTDYWSPKQRNASDGQVEDNQQDNAKEKIALAKSSVDNLKSILVEFKAKAKNIRNNDAKTSFVTAMYAQIKEVEIMIDDAKKQAKAESKMSEAIIKNKIARILTASIQNRIDKSNDRISKLKVLLSEAKTEVDQRNIHNRIHAAKYDLKEQLADLRNIKTSEAITHTSAQRVKFEENNDFKSWRKLTFAEKKVGWSSLQKYMDKTEEAMSNEAKEVLNTAKDNYTRQLTNALNKNDKQGIKSLSLKFKTEYSSLLKKFMQDAYVFGKNNASKEMDVTTPASENVIMSNIDLMADTIATKHSDDLLYNAKLTVVQQLEKGKNVAESIGAVDAVLSQKILSLTRDTSSIVVAGHINLGRKTVFDKYANKIYALQRSEILDTATCNFCLSIDARIIEQDDSMGKVGTFHSNCRGIWVEILKGEEDLPKISGIPNSIRDRIGDATNELVQPTTPIVKKDSLAQKQIDKGKAGK